MYGTFSLERGGDIIIIWSPILSHGKLNLKGGILCGGCLIWGGLPPPHLPHPPPGPDPRCSPWKQSWDATEPSPPLTAPNVPSTQMRPIWYVAPVPTVSVRRGGGGRVGLFKGYVPGGMCRRPLKREMLGSAKFRPYQSKLLQRHSILRRGAIMGNSLFFDTTTTTSQSSIGWPKKMALFTFGGGWVCKGNTGQK